MSKLAFSDLPMIVRIMTCASMFMVWVLIAEFVIDRYGFHEVIPYYRLGDVCPYELLILFGIGVFWVKAHKNTN
ncbi:MAG: hypothetical protein AAF423_12175 [Pseudomonadota bacterium]